MFGPGVSTIPSETRAKAIRVVVVGIGFTLGCDALSYVIPGASEARESGIQSLVSSGFPGSLPSAAPPE